MKKVGPPPKPLRLVDSFPYRSMRPFQKEALEQIEAALASAKYVIVEAPVGFGKSAVAAALCRYLGSAHILTATKQLQDQYASDFGFPVIKGKSNFHCYIPTTSGRFLPCSKGRCEVDWKLNDCPHYLTLEEYQTHKQGACARDSKCEHLRDDRLCPYYDQKWSGYRAPVTVYNYPFLLSELKYVGNVPRRRLLVCDETHDLERQIVSAASFAIRKPMLQYYHDSVRHDEKFMIPDKGVEDASAWLDIITGLKEVLEIFYNAHKGLDAEQDTVALCKDLLEDTTGFVDDLKENPENWVVNRVRKSGDGSVEEVVFQPILVAGYTHLLFNVADHVLLMSATIFSKQRLCHTLGISEQEAYFIQISESTFPIENRLIYALNTAQLNRASMDASLDSLAKAIDEIMSRHTGERGVIHTTSYAQVNRITPRLSEPNRRRLVTTEGSFDRSTLLQIHGANDASVLISPSLYQGVDLKDDLSRFQIIVKVPYPDLSERRTAVKLRKDPEWYDWQTALRLVQTYGRSIRSETDHAATYVLDSNFTRFVNTHRSLFPKFFLESLRPILSRNTDQATQKHR